MLTFYGNLKTILLNLIVFFFQEISLSIKNLIFLIVYVYTIYYWLALHNMCPIKCMAGMLPDTSHLNGILKKRTLIWIFYTFPCMEPGMCKNIIAVTYIYVFQFG